MLALDNHTTVPFKLIHLKPDINEDRETLAHRHNYYELFIFENEGKEHLIDFDTYGVEKYSIHLVLPGSIHLLKRNAFTKGYVLLFSDDFYHLHHTDNTLWHDIIPNVLLNGASIKPPIKIFQTIIELCRQMAESKSKKLHQAYLRLIILHLKNTVNHNTKLNINTNTSDAYIFRKNVEEHFQVEHQINFYCKKQNLTVTALNTKVKSVFGITTSEIIQDRIILEAKRLLFHTDLSAKEIAFLLNFSDASHFGKFFKKRINQSPNLFREESRVQY